MPIEIPDVVIDRLPVYARALSILERNGREVVSSQELGATLGVTPAQIRKDLSYFGRFGKQGRGYNVKRLLEALRSVARGESLLDSKVTKSVLEKLVAQHEKASEDDELTAREREVLVLIAEGATNKEIAAKLVVSENTARNHVSHILSKLGFSRRSEAAAYAAKKGLTSG